MPSSKETPKEAPTFETAMEGLEKIVAEMESDSLPLEDLLTRYEEGLRLVKICGEKLDAAEKKIELITRTAGGRPKAVDFAEPAGGTPPSTAPESSVTEKSQPGLKSPEVRLF